MKYIQGQNRYQATLDKIDALFDEANHLLRNKMDNLMLLFRGTDPEFYSAYERAGSIVD